MDGKRERGMTEKAVEEGHTGCFEHVTMACQKPK